MDAAGQVTTQGNCADVGSQPCLVIDPAGNVTELQLDALGRPVMTVAPNGVSSEEHYDAAGRRDWSKNGLGRKTSYEYDAAGRLAKVTDPVGGATEYGYDARGNRTSVKDANGNVTAFAYDRANRLVTETNPIGKVTAYEYDLAGNRKAKTDANGRTAYQYDANRRLRKVLFADGTSYDYDYDVRGNRTLERSRTHERGLAYDALGRLSEVEDRTLGRKITYGYDAAGNRTRMEVDTGEVVQYRWDALGRLDTVIDPEGEGTRFRYDAAGRRERAEYGNRTTATYGYDAAGQVLSIVYASAAGDVATAFGYAYDAAGNRTYKRFGDGTEERYGYDGLDRLVAVDYPSGRHVDYGYEAVGNRKSLVDSAVTVERWPTSATASAGTTTGVVGAPNSTYWTPPNTTANPHWVELTYAVAERAAGVKVHEWYGSPSVMRVDLIEPDGTSHTAYEGGDRTADKGWLTVKFPVTAYAVKKVRVWTVRTGAASEQIESVGLLAAKTDTYQYNGFNQLLGVTGNDGTSTTFGYDGNGNQVAKTDARGLTEYVYDLDNRLVGIALPGGGSNAYEYDANGLRTKKTDSAGTTAYLLDGLSVIAQYAPDGARQAWYTQSLARIDEVLNVVNGQGKYWYQSDALGSVYTLANADGTVRARGGYDVFGAAVAEYGQSVGQPFGFTGREHEVDSGLVYARDRYQGPAWGRWTQADRLGFAAGPNAYAYAGAQPTAFTDPTGQIVVPAWIILGGIGAIYGAVFSFVGGYISGLSGWPLVRHVAIGTAAGIASMLLTIPGVPPIVSTAIVNGVVSAVGSLAQQAANKGIGGLGLDDFISAAISGVMAALATVLVGIGIRAGISPVFNELFTHLSPDQAATAAMSATATGVGAISDFVLQVLVIPAMREANRAMMIEAMFRERYDSELGVCQ